MNEEILFYNYFLNFIKESNYSEWICKDYVKNIYFKSDILDKFKNELIKGLYKIAKYALTDYYNILKNDDENITYNEYCEKLNDSKFIEKFHENYKVLKKLLNQKIDYELSNMTRVILDVSNNYSEIIDTFNISKENKIKEVNIFLGDSHREKVVAKIIFENDICLMYKSREILGEKLILEISSLLNISFAIPKTIKINNFYIQEFIKEDVFIKEEQIEEYYFKFGKMAAVFTSLGTTDLHSENVIATVSGPKFIDLETIIPALQGKLAFKGSAIQSTLLFPGSNDNKIYSGIDISAFSGGSILKEIEIRDIIKNKNDVYIGNNVINIPENSNIPKINSTTRVNPIKYKRFVLDGFDETVEEILKKKDELIKIIKNNLFGSIRRVIRNTAFYATYLDTSFMPMYLKSYDKRKSLFQLLTKHSKMDKEIVEIEVKDLSNLLIPFFEYNLNGSSKYSINLESYFERLEQIDKSFFEQERNVILMSVELLNNNNNNNNTYNINLYGKSRIDFECSKFIKNGIKGNIFSYITIDKSISNGLINYSNDMYIFGGSLLVLALIDKYNNKDIYKEVILNTITQDWKKSKSISGLTGAQSENLLIYFMYVIYKEEKLLQILEEKIYKNLQLKLDTIESFDFSTIGSAIVSETIIKNKIKSNNLEESINKLIKIFIEKKDEGLNNSGLFHGYAGELVAIMALAVNKGLDNYKEKIIQIIELENSLFLENISNWNDTRGNDIHDMVAISYGAPGILISRILLNIFIDKIEHKDRSWKEKVRGIVYADIKKAITKIVNLQRDDFYDDTLINGYAGALLSLVLVWKNYKYLFNDKENKKIINYIKDARKDMENTYWRCQGVTDAYIPNFMNGNMGIVFVLLLIDKYEFIKGLVKNEKS